MAKDKTLTTRFEEDTLIKELGTQSEKAREERDNIQDDPYASWDEKEAMLFGRPKDSGTSTSKSQVFDPRLPTIALERAARVMAQFPTGKVQSLSKSDKGKNMLMNLVLTNYVQPNADAQFDLLTKLRMTDLYSMVYGGFSYLVDWRTDDDYIGPDIWLIPMRSFLWQPGKVSIDDCDYVFVDTYVSRSFLESRNKDTWQNLDKLLKELDDKAGSDKGSRNNRDKTYSEQQFEGQGAEKGQYAQVLLRTRYEPDRWLTFAVDFPQAGVLRDIPNPQKNNTIPVVMKQCFPLLDRFIGLGEFERGKTLQYAINSLINLYLDGVKMSIFPPVIVDPNGVVGSSIQMKPAVKWLETKANSIRDFPISPQGINSFQSTYSFLIAALLNQAGTTDTTVNSQTDPGMGKTPEALKMLGARENARDSWDRFMMEKAIEKTYNLFVDLIANRQEKPIDLYLFKDEINQIKELYPDVTQLFESEAFGKVSVRKGMLNSKYRFFIDSGTTMKKDEMAENESLQNILLMISKIPQLMPFVNPGELFKRILITSGASDWDKIINEAAIEQEGQVVPGQAVMAQGGQPQVMPQGMPPQVPGQQVAPQIPPIQSQDPAVLDLAQKIAQAAQSGNSNTNI